MNEMLSCVHTRLGAEFLHPEFGFYTDLPLTERELFFPTEEEVRTSVPCATGWMTGIEDGALNTGLNLEAQAIGFELSGDDRYMQRGRRLIDGVLTLATCGKTGFLARSICDKEGTHYPHSSVDQYTLAVFGLWRVYRSPIPTADQKSRILAVLCAIADKFFNENGEITGDNGQPERNFTQGGPRDRVPGVERTLEMFLAAYSTSGNAKYLQYYHSWMNDTSQPPVPKLLREWRPHALIETYALWQTQCALRLMWEVEIDVSVRASYQAAMQNVADLCVPRLQRHRLRCDHMLRGKDHAGWRKCYENFEGWSNLKELMGLSYYYYYCNPIQAHETEFVVNPLLAANAISLNPVVEKGASAEVDELLNAFDVGLCRLSHSLVLFENLCLRVQALRAMTR